MEIVANLFSESLPWRKIRVYKEEEEEELDVFGGFEDLVVYFSTL